MDGIHNLYKVRVARVTAPAANGNGSAAYSNGGNGKGTYGNATGGPVANGKGAATNGAAGAPADESVVNVAIAPLVSKEGQRIGRLIIFDDVTDRDELERRRPGCQSVIQMGIADEGVAERLARGTSGDLVPRMSGRKFQPQPVA